MSSTEAFDLTPPRLDALLRLGVALIDQEAARVIVPPERGAPGFWFGGGNMVLDADGSLLLVGRYRNHGDSRTGLAAGERGKELVIFRMADLDAEPEKLRSFTKADLDVGAARVLSIEGSALRRGEEGLEVFVSSEKDVDYPAEVGDYRKPGTGVWTVDRFAAESVEGLDSSSIERILDSDTPAVLHVKDPVVFELAPDRTALIYCTHPFGWSSSNTGAAVREPGESAFTRVGEGVLRRGNVWDVAASRVTDRLAVPRVGRFRDAPPLSLYFYDGAECVREHGQHSKAVRRRRGYSCEEIGGLAWGLDADFPAMESLTVNAPLFVSPRGTGCSRYVSTLVTDDAVLAIWQQSQSDGSQPLVGHDLPMEKVEGILAG